MIKTVGGVYIPPGISISIHDNGTLKTEKPFWEERLVRPIDIYPEHRVENFNETNVFYQNTFSSKENLLKQYIENKNSILFGTNSFWEGIDLPNDLLEILVFWGSHEFLKYNPLIISFSLNME